MTDRPKISIIVPVYNSEAFLERCFGSILDQSYDNVELIVVNDRSPDDSNRIIEAHARSDPRVVPVEHETNRGLHVSRMTGFRQATGDYIGYVDSDDWVPANTFETALNLLSDHEADFVRFNFRLVDSDGNPLPDNFRSPTERNAFASGIDYLEMKFYPSMWSYLHARQLWEKALPFFPEERFIGEDNLTSFILAFFAGKCVSTPERLYYYATNPASLMREGSVANVRTQIDDRHRILVLLDAFLKKHGDRARPAYARLVHDNFGLIIDQMLPRLAPEEKAQAALHLLEKFGPLIQAQGYAGVTRYQQTRQALDTLQSSLSWRLLEPVRRGKRFLQDSYQKRTASL